MIAFVDGTPSSNWDALPSWNGAYLMSGDSDPTFTGSNTHSHTNANVTSATWYETQPPTTSLTGGPNQHTLYPGGHNHVVTLFFASANHEPVNVQLYPVKLNTTLGGSWGGTWGGS